MISNNKYDNKVDIWALGCILYEMCCLEVPFTANSMSKLKRKIIAGVYETKRISRYSTDLIYMIKFLLEKCVHLRPSIEDVMRSNIFKKRAREYDLFNSNINHSKFDKKVQVEYDVPIKTLGWNNLIRKIEENKNTTIKTNKKEVNDDVINITRDINQKIIEKPPDTREKNHLKQSNLQNQSKLQKQSKNSYDVYHYLKSRRDKRIQYIEKSNDNSNNAQLPKIPNFQIRKDNKVRNYRQNIVKLPKLR